MQSTALDYVALVTGIGGGLALFLYGMRKMSDALKTVAGGRMKAVLARLTTNRFTAAASGALVTAVIQSSSVTTVMVVGFISAGLINFTQSVGIIMGANIGTTITAQIIAFKITKYSLVMIALGFLLELVGKSARVRYYGTALMGLGLLFFGMELMSSAAMPLRSFPPFIELMQEMRNPLLGIAVGALFTALVQSSSATTGIVIVLATQGFISLEAGIALIFGANVGTCVTAMLAAIGKPREAKQAAVVHVLFNLIGVLLWVGFIPLFANLVREISPLASELQGAARLAAEVPRQIANAHTLFNIGNTLIFLGFAGLIARVVEWLVPLPKVMAADRGRAVFLDDLYLTQPAVALDRSRMELGRLTTHVRAMADHALPHALSGGYDELHALQEEEEGVDKLYAEIVGFLGELSTQDLVEPQPRQLQMQIGVANYLENLADVVGTGFVPAGAQRLEKRISVSEDAAAGLTGLHRFACRSLEQAGHAFDSGDVDSARTVLESKESFNQQADALRLQFVQQMSRSNVQQYHFLLGLIDHIKRVHTLARRLSRLVVDSGREDRAQSGEAA